MMNFNNPYLSGGMLPAQQRLMQMEAQFPQYAQTFQPAPQIQQNLMQQPQNAFNTSLVTNQQEAQALPLMPNCTNVSIDNGSQKVYIKKLNSDGTSEFKTYLLEGTLAAPASEEKSAGNVNIPVDELTSVKNEINALRNNFEKSFINLSVDIENTVSKIVTNEIKKLKGEKVNAK